MSTSYDERAHWANQVAALKHDELATVRAVAAKWQATLTGLLAGFTGVGFVWGPDKVKDFPVDGAARVALLVLVLAGGAVAVAALVRVNAAANGDLAIVPTMTGEILAGLSHRDALRSHRDLMVARRFAVVAAGLVVGATTWLLFAAAAEPAASPKPPTIVVHAPHTTLCGTLVTGNDGVAALEVGDDDPRREVPIPAGSKIDVVAACG